MFKTLLLYFILTISVFSQGNWKQILPDPTKYTIASAFINRDTGYIGGNYSRLYVTHDAGNTLLPLNFPQGTYIARIIPISYGKLLIISSSNYPVLTLFQTTDNGVNWTSGILPGTNLFTIKVLDTALWIGMARDTLYKSTNRGISWTPYDVFPWFITRNYTHLEIVNKNTWCVVIDNQWLYKTTNAGISWLGLPHTIPEVKFDFIAFSVDTLLFTSGKYNENGIYVSVNGGLNWVFKPLPMNPNVNASIFKDKPDIIVRVDKSFFRSTDFGNSFTKVFDLFFDQSFINVDQYKCYSYSSYNFFRTTDGGLTWVTRNLKSKFTNLTFIDENHGWCTNPSFMITTTGGKTWIYTVFKFTDFSFVSNMTGFATGENYFCKTKNGGISWDTLNYFPGYYMRDIFFLNESLGWLILETHSGDALLKKTTDGGLTWNDHLFSDFRPYSVKFIDSQRGIISGLFSGYYTTDQGLTWIENNGVGKNIYIRNENDIILGDFAFMRRSNDGGIAFQSLAFPDYQYINSISFIDERNGYAGADSGVFKTTDGGLSWLKDIPGKEANISFVDNIGYAGFDFKLFKIIEQPVSVNDEPLQASEFTLYQNYPNPFNPSTTIKFYIPFSSKVLLKVYDILGREVRQLIDSEMNKGVHELKFNASDLASGIYIYRLTYGNMSSEKKLLLLK